MTEKANSLFMGCILEEIFANLKGKGGKQMDTIKIGKFLAENRKKKKLTQEQLGEKIGVTAKTIPRWENGNYMPDISLLKPLTQELGITLNDFICGEKVEVENYQQKTEENMDLILQEYYQMKKQRKILRICLLTVCVILVSLIFYVCTIFGASLMLLSIHEREVVTDIARYTEVIGKEAKGDYQNKWGMDESIFPQTVQIKQVKDFKIIYENAWDAEFLGYLVMEYPQEEYAKEMQRLQETGIQAYQGIYGVTGFSKYQLVAMEADDYHGFVYAITDGTSKIIYVEIIFCNYFLDIPYQQEIPTEYLPDGFDASIDNLYQKYKMRESNKIF